MLGDSAAVVLGWCERQGFCGGCSAESEGGGHRHGGGNGVSYDGGFLSV